MVDDGRLALDDPVQRYLPPGVLLVRGRPITLGDGFALRSLRHRANPYAWFDVGELHAGLPATRMRRAPGGRPRCARPSPSFCASCASSSGNDPALVRAAGADACAAMATARRVGGGAGLDAPDAERQRPRAPATDTPAVMLANSSRSVDPLGFRMLERIGAP
jgi:hypothetical protein